MRWDEMGWKWLERGKFLLFFLKTRWTWSSPGPIGDRPGWSPSSFFRSREGVRLFGRYLHSDESALSVSARTCIFQFRRHRPFRLLTELVVQRKRREKRCVYINGGNEPRKSTTGAIIFERPCDGIQVSPLSSSVRREAGGIASKVFPSKGERTLFLKKLLVDLMRNEKGGPSISLSHV